ncbi:hypothetical protein ACTQ49_04980 [Luteococcus sp. Sow4_B9]|uniref:hypothetical protein n=1 Tax=Luteococcus sp. Sow4_B9 TaxID=3438792 RepID=UPI003F9B6273
MVNLDSSSTIDAINLRLSLLGLPIAEDNDPSNDGDLVAPIIARHREVSRRLGDRLCAADLRVQGFLDDYLQNTDVHPHLPQRTLVLDHPGLARALSLPHDGDEFHSALLSSYRLANGVLHNPANDRRTTAGVFHIAEGGLPIQDDKLAVPVDVFARLLDQAFQPPVEDLQLPFTANQEQKAACFVSLLLRPLVVPAVPGFTRERTMEVRFIVPGGLVSNLDFVEGIFGNAGDPHLPENDASLDPEGWTGTTGAVILAPHLTRVTKKSLGLPHVNDATERQKRDGMCWENDDELYNNGQAFKLCARDERGVIVTVIADNYFGYCKKEVKTQISYSANLFGLAEEEHSGGALAFPAYNLGQEWTDTYTPDDFTVADVVARNPERFEQQPQGHATDREQAHLVVVPGKASYSMRTQQVTWTNPDGSQGSTPLLAGKTYLAPNGYRVHAKPRDADPTQWHLIGTSPSSTQLHKPATVSGGGKSEISKSLLDAFVFGSAFTADVDADLDMVQELLDRDYSDRFRDPAADDQRSILSSDRSLGSVIKLLTPRAEFTDEYNQWLETIPPHVSELVFTVKRYYKPEWGTDWRSHFTVGVINGRKGNSLRLDGEKIMVNMLRVGFEADGSWRLFSLRPDFSPAMKVQTEDDITASVVAPPLGETTDPVSAKYVQNCEQLLFQRPDDAIHRGYDKQTELDMSGDDSFISNFHPLTREEAREIVADAPGLSAFTEPMRQRIIRFAQGADDERPLFLAVSSEPRIVADGKRSKNPRYLQKRPDLTNPEGTAAASLAVHLQRKTAADEPLRMPVDVVAAGRRNNAAEEGVPPLCAYNPLHYMELPELFMEFISSMTGKSPSTTGAGSEGAMTKAPFNALPSIIDLNAALLSFALTETDGWLSSAGVIGPKVRVDHDISLLVPEIFSRMWPEERKAQNLIDGGYLEKMTDFEHQGRTIQASRLGYRMNHLFATNFFGRIFLHPDMVFTDEMLRPELQDPDVFAESVDVIVTTHQRVAQTYFTDGTISLAVPPLKALLEIMAHGHSEKGWTLDSPEFRESFSRRAILDSGWYAQRLAAKQNAEAVQLKQGVTDLAPFVKNEGNAEPVGRLALDDRLATLQERLQMVQSPAYLESLNGTLGRQVSFG